MYTIVSDLMRVRHSSVLPESASLREAAERLIISDCDVLAVTDSAGKLIGLVSESCVVRALLAGTQEAAEIRSIVSHYAPSVRPDSALNCVLPLFRTASVTALPVKRETGEVCGLLLRRDVIAALVRNGNRAVNTPAKGDCRQAHFEANADNATPAVDDSQTAPSEEYSEPVREPQVPRWNASNLAGPHFLRGPAAKRILWPAEDRL